MRGLEKIKDIHKSIRTDMVTYRPTRPRGAELVKKEEEQAKGDEETHKEKMFAGGGPTIRAFVILGEVDISALI